MFGFGIYKLLSPFFDALKVSKKKIVLTQFIGSDYGENPKYICDYILSNKIDYELVWLFDYCKNKKLAKFPRQIKVVDFYSLKALKELATAGVWIDNCRKSLFPPKKKDQVYLQTWHGSFPLKAIEKDAEKTLDAHYLNIARTDSQIADAIISGTSFMTGIIKRAFWFNGEILEIGNPKCDIFFSEKKRNHAKLKVSEYYSLDSNSKIILYAPTFRKDFDFYPYRIDYFSIKTEFESKFDCRCAIIARLHPNLVQFSDTLNLPDFVINATLYDDMNELLCAADLIITDYSSVMFEAILMNKIVFLFCMDLEKYITEDRKLYLDPKMLPFPFAENNKELLIAIEKFNNNTYQNDIGLFKKKIGSYEQGTASRAVIDWIVKKQAQNNG